MIDLNCDWDIILIEDVYEIIKCKYIIIYFLNMILIYKLTFYIHNPINYYLSPIIKYNTSIITIYILTYII